MTFREYAKRNWASYATSLVPFAVVFGLTTAALPVSPWVWVIGPVCAIFLAGLVSLQLYNRWYPYYSPTDGMLRDKKPD